MLNLFFREICLVDFYCYDSMRMDGEEFLMWEILIFVFDLVWLWVIVRGCFWNFCFGDLGEVYWWEVDRCMLWFSIL